MTVFGLTVEFAVRLPADVPAEIVDDEEIKQAIIVHVHPSGAHGAKRPIVLKRMGVTGFFRYIGERAIPVVVVESITVDAGDENVFVAIVVVITDRHSDVISRSGESCFFSDIGEGAVSIVLKQSIPVFR